MATTQYIHQCQGSDMIGGKLTRCLHEARFLVISENGEVTKEACANHMKAIAKEVDMTEAWIIKSTDITE